MSNFDDERQNIENDAYEQIKNTGKIGSKMASKTTTKAGKKLIARKGYKKFTGSIIKGGKLIGRGLLSFGKAFILAIKTLTMIFLSWGWILILVLVVVVLFWILLPALKQYTFDSINDDPGIFETNINLSKENKALDNYFKFYSDKALTQNKVAIFYNDVDYRKTGRELFDELNKKEYIIGPRKPTKIVPPSNTSSTSSGNDSNSPIDSSGSFQQSDGSYNIPKINKIVKVEWDNGGNTRLPTVHAKSGAKLSENQIKQGQFLVLDIQTEEIFYLTKTMGSNHNDVEYSTAEDAKRMQKVLTGSNSKGQSNFDNWTVRPVFVIQGDTAIMATWTTKNHAGVDKSGAFINVGGRSGGYGSGSNLDAITNGVDGHMDLYFHRGIGHKQSGYTNFTNFSKDKITELWSENPHYSVMIDLENKVNNKTITVDTINNSKYGTNSKQNTTSSTQNFNESINDTNTNISSNNNINSDTILKTLKEMEGFISKETIDGLQSYWVSKAQPTLGWDWNTEELRKELNKLINYSYDIKPFENIKTDKFTYLKQEQLSSNVELKDKYHREQYFNVTPELLYSLNNSLYKEKFLHTNSLIKPVKTIEINGKLQLDGNAFILDNNKDINYLIKDENWYADEEDLPKDFKESISSYLKEKENEEENEEQVKEDYNKYGLGTVFVYRPIITFNIERGIEINQRAVTSEITVVEDGKEVTVTKTDSKPDGRVIDNIDCKIEYVLDRAITFEGEYVFKYEQTVEVLEERNVENLTYDREGDVWIGNLIQSKKYEVTETPSDIIFQDKGRTYIYNYLENFKSNIPEDITKGIHIDKIVETFYDYKSLGEIKNTNSNASSNISSPNNVIKDVDLSSLNLPAPREGEDRSLADVLSIGKNKDGANVKAALKYLDLFQKYGEMYGIDPYLLVAKSATESSGDPNANNGAAKGLMQIEYTVKNVKAYNHNTGQIDTIQVNSSRLFEPEYNIQIGTMELAQRGADSNYNILAALQGYNFGPAGIKFAIQYYLNGGNLTINDNFDNARVTAYMASNHIGWLTAQYPGDLPKEKQYREANSNDGKHNARMWYSNTGFKKYNQGAGTPVHLERVLANYPGTTGPWFKNKEGDVITLDGSMMGSGSIFADSETISKAVKQYDEYEENGWFGKLTRFSASIEADKVELMLGLATAMKEEISMTSIRDANYSYWDSEYIKDNFVNGLPKGRNYTDYNKGKNSNRDWKKILNTVEFIRKNIGQSRIGRIRDLTTSQVIGYAYEINANINVPKTPLEIKQKIKTKVNSVDKIQLGDILLLETKVLNEDLEGIHPYVTETAIFIGEENGENKYAIVNNNVLVIMDIDIIKELYNIDSIVRPILNQYSGDGDSSSNGNQNLTTGGEWAWPATTNVISSDFGPRNITKGSNPHKGIDIVDVLDGKHLEGTDVPILASKDGVVHYVSHTSSGNAGVYVVLEHSDGTLSEYMHLKPGSTSHVKVGQSFKQGEQVGIMGTTGQSSGIHLHFSIKSLDKNNFKDIETAYPGSVLLGIGNYYFVDPELLLSKPENLKVYRGGGKWNLSYQN